jgi:hypothetical protein
MLGGAAVGAAPALAVASGVGTVVGIGVGQIPTPATITQLTGCGEAVVHAIGVAPGAGVVTGNGFAAVYGAAEAFAGTTICALPGELVGKVCPPAPQPEMHTNPGVFWIVTPGVLVTVTLPPPPPPLPSPSAREHTSSYVQVPPAIALTLTRNQVRPVEAMLPTYVPFADTMPEVPSVVAVIHVALVLFSGWFEATCAVAVTPLPVPLTTREHVL